MKIIERILRLIKETGKTDVLISNEIGLTRGLITQWKQGKQKPSVNTIIKIAQYFNVSADYLLGIETKENPITEKEQKLLSYFRKCNTVKQDLVFAYLKGLTDNIKEK